MSQGQYLYTLFEEYLACAQTLYINLTSFNVSNIRVNNVNNSKFHLPSKNSASIIPMKAANKMHFLYSNTRRFVICRFHAHHITWNTKSAHRAFAPNHSPTNHENEVKFARNILQKTPIFLAMVYNHARDTRLITRND